MSNYLKDSTRSDAEIRALKTETKEIQSFNILEVEAVTNTPQGGDTGSGGRTYFGLSDLASTDWSVRLNGKEWLRGDSVEIALGGDAEAETFIEALEFAVATLKKQQQENKK